MSFHGWLSWSSRDTTAYVDFLCVRRVVLRGREERNDDVCRRKPGRQSPQSDNYRQNILVTILSTGARVLYRTQRLRCEKQTTERSRFDRNDIYAQVHFLCSYGRRSVVVYTWDNVYFHLCPAAAAKWAEPSDEPPPPLPSFLLGRPP